VNARSVIVTGAAQGIGRELATTFALGGDSVGLVDRDGTALDDTVRALRDAGLRVEPVVAELGVPAEAAAAVDRLAATLGRLDVLVNNAGGSAHTPLRFEDVTEEDFDRVVDWNLKSTFFATAAAVPHLRAAGGGSVVNISAIAGRAGTELLPPQYSAAKAGVIGLTRNLARHLGPDGIRVNSVAPGFIKSGSRVEAIWHDREDPTQVLAMIPLRRRGEMSEVAAAVMFLATDASSYITGAVIDVNGGFFCL